MSTCVKHKGCFESVPCLSSPDAIAKKAIGNWWPRAVPDEGTGIAEFRQARADDLDQICWLVDHWATHGENLPRSREDIMEDPRYYELRNSALDFLYNRFAHDDDA